MDVWYARLEHPRARREAPDGGRHQAGRDSSSKAVAKAQTKDSIKALSKLTRMVDGEPRIVSEPPLIVPLAELVEGQPGAEAGIGDLVRSFSAATGARFRTIGATCSTDSRSSTSRTRSSAWAASGRDAGSRSSSAGTRRDPLFLQLKEAQASVLEPHLGRSRYGNHGRRVVEGQRLMQAASDIFLGWHRIAQPDGQARDFYSANSGTGRSRPTSTPRRPHARALRAGSAAGRSRGPCALGRPDRDRRVPRQGTTASTRRSPRSRRHTPTSTSGTTSHSRPPRRTAASRSSTASRRGRASWPARTPRR